MDRAGHPHLFRAQEQPDLFGDSPPPAYRPDPDKVRSRLHKILAEARAADRLPGTTAMKRNALRDCVTGRAQVDSHG
jgi:hypothetical protein